jgi:DNA-binding HxlR family transcriptional regulator
MDFSSTMIYTTNMAEQYLTTQITNNNLGDTLSEMDRGLSLLERRGTLLIIRALEEGHMRFTDLLRLTHLPPRTLTTRLVEMTDANLINREQFWEIPPRVEYSLNDTGRKLLPIAHEIAGWAKVM